MPPLAYNGFYLTLALLVACTIVGIIMAVRYRREVDDLAPTTAKEVLSPLEDAYYSGLMHPAEIEKIRESVKRAKLLHDTLPRKRARVTTFSDLGATMGDGSPFDGGISHDHGGHAAGDAGGHAASDAGGHGGNDGSGHAGGGDGGGGDGGGFGGH